MRVIKQHWLLEIVFNITAAILRRKVIMSDFSIREMLTMQQTLQEKYKDKWETICPEAGKHKLLWMIGEIGEVVDIIKKNGDIKSLEDSDLRKHLIEESERPGIYYLWTFNLLYLPVIIQDFLCRSYRNQVFSDK